MSLTSEPSDLRSITKPQTESEPLDILYLRSEPDSISHYSYSTVYGFVYIQLYSIDSMDFVLLLGFGSIDHNLLYGPQLVWVREYVLCLGHSIEYK